jgi:hypothetical protein
LRRTADQERSGFIVLPRDQDRAHEHFGKRLARRKFADDRFVKAAK